MSLTASASDPHLTRSAPFVVGVLGPGSGWAVELPGLLRDAGYRVLEMESGVSRGPRSVTPDAVIASSSDPCEGRGSQNAPALPTLVLGGLPASAGARQELLLRVGVLCRQGREQRLNAQDLRRFLVLDVEERTVSGPRGMVRLTSTEQGLLATLLAAGGRVVGREHLVRVTWGGAGVPSRNSLDSCVPRLRAKLDVVAVLVGVTTIRGRGYRLVADHRST